MSALEPNLLEVATSCRSRSFLSEVEARDDAEGKWNVTHRHPTWTSDKLVLETDHPFSDMIIQDNAFLDKLEERQPCDICHKSRKFFCYTCHVPLPSIRNLIPRVQLPIQVT